MELIYIVILGGKKYTWDASDQMGHGTVAWHSNRRSFFANPLVFLHLSGIYLYSPAAAAAAFYDSHSIHCVMDGASPTVKQRARLTVGTSDHHLTATAINLKPTDPPCKYTLKEFEVNNRLSERASVESKVGGKPELGHC